MNTVFIDWHEELKNVHEHKKRDSLNPFFYLLRRFVSEIFHSVFEIRY